MKKIFTILFLLTGIFAYSQHESITVQNREKTRDGNLRREIPANNNDFKNDLIDEDFETWPPQDWQIINGTSSVGNQQWHQEGSTDMYAAVQYDNGDGVVRDQDEWLITPQINIPENAFLTFDFSSNPYWMIDPNDNADLNVLVSTNGTDWTEIWSEGESEFEYDAWTDAYIDLSDYLSQSIYIAFQYVGSDACWFYIDNVRVYSLPEVDIEITDARINFFQIYDYHSSAEDFHYSSHYSKIPLEVLEGNDNAYLAFNALVINKGFGNCKVQCNVSVKDPDGTEIYNSTSYNEKVIGEMESDTVDIAYVDGEEFLLDDPKIGTYEVIYTVFDGEPGVTPIDIHKNKEILTKTLSFEVTDKEYSRAGDSNDEFVGPQYWEGGGTDGDILTVKYMFFEDTRIDNVKAFIHEDTDPGCQLICNIWQYDENSSSYIIVANSSLVTVESSDIGTWKTFEFTDPGWVYMDGDYAATSVLIGFEFYYSGEDSYLWLGCDKTTPSSYWGTLWYMQAGENSNQWYAITNFVGVPMIKLELFDESGNAELNNFNKDINIFPNPAADFARLDGVKDCNIRIIDNNGKVIDQFVSGEEMFDIDLKSYSSGIYYLLITDKSDESNRTVRKLDIIK